MMLGGDAIGRRAIAEARGAFRLVKPGARALLMLAGKAQSRSEALRRAGATLTLRGRGAYGALTTPGAGAMLRLQGAAVVAGATTVQALAKFALRIASPRVPGQHVLNLMVIVDQGPLSVRGTLREWTP